jgi:hypothetical protein
MDEGLGDEAVLPFAEYVQQHAVWPRLERLRLTGVEYVCGCDEVAEWLGEEGYAEYDPIERGKWEDVEEWDLAWPKVVMQGQFRGHVAMAACAKSVWPLLLELKLDDLDTVMQEAADTHAMVEADKAKYVAAHGL